MAAGKRSTVYRGVEIQYHAPDRKTSARWSVSRGFMRGRDYFPSQQQARKAIDAAKDGSKAPKAAEPRSSAKGAVAGKTLAPMPARPSVPSGLRRGSGANLGKVFEAAVTAPTRARLPRSGRDVAIPTVLRTERVARRRIPSEFGTVPNKPPIEYRGHVLYPEFVLVQLLERAGWSAAWSKNWGGRAFWRGIGEDVRLPDEVSTLFGTLSVAAGERGGAWDIVAWRRDRVLFVESKQRGKDRLRPTQLLWLDAALAFGLSIESFAIVEYVMA